MDENDFTLTDSAPYCITRLYQLVNDKFTKTLKEFYITPSQWCILMCVFEGKSETPAQIARQIGVDGAAITRLLDRLEKKNYIERKRDGLDRRSLKVLLTPQAIQLIPKLITAARFNSSTLFEGLSEGEITSFKAQINKMLRNAGLATFIY